METEDKCAICLCGLFCQPIKYDINEIKLWCGVRVGFKIEYMNDILEKSHKEICRTNCGHSFHKQCLLDYFETNNNISKYSCPLCRHNIRLIESFSRSGKTREDYLKRGVITCPSYKMYVRSLYNT